MSEWTPEKHAEARKLCAAGQWQEGPDSGSLPELPEGQGYQFDVQVLPFGADAAFVAAGRNLLSEALAEIERLQARSKVQDREIDRLGESLRRVAEARL